MSDLRKRVEGGKSLVKAAGFSLTRPRFDDQALETEYESEAFLKIFEHWKQASVPLALASVAVVGLHWILMTKVPVLLVMAEVCLLAVLMASLVFRQFQIDRHRFEISFGLTLLGQAATLTILATTSMPKEIIVCGYLTILIGGLAPQKSLYRTISVILPTVAFTVMLISLEIYKGRYVALNTALCWMVAGLTLTVGHGREEADRLSFLLKRQVDDALDRSNRLLVNILPANVAARMKEMPEAQGSLVERFDCVTVLFADLVGFTSFAASHSADDTVRVLSDIFRRFDAIAAQSGIEKIKTIGDAYMAVAGLPDPCQDHTLRIADAALEMREALKKYCALMGPGLELRIGIHRGPVIAGVIGTKKFLYDLWGDTVNIASRLESQGLPGEIQVSREVADALAEVYTLTRRGTIELKGKGPTEAFILERPAVAITSERAAA